MRVTRILGTVAAAVALVAGPGLAQPAHAATVTVSGTVSCEYGRAVVGVWVQANSGGSGFASWSAIPGRVNVASYSRAVSSGTVSLHIGCGGTGGSWWGDNWTGGVNVGGNATLNARCYEAAGTGTRCNWPARGATTDRNWFVAGYCTWGAADIWRSRTGSYPGWGGNALDWDTNAAAKGWTVVDTPRARSVVVMEPGATTSSLGHVGWVNHYYLSGGTVYLNITDMNSSGFGVWSTYDRAWKPGYMRFVLAPTP
ncbi:CHAP domain-containing protein [Catellatospora bangladeshensis]|uniref:Peptidase C51 domain-containing protein n=1 Tax=Catellatospora bangladeshensis TaxID=310355 RepID=A0A8J3JB67_9ACTN|nr:CHAP domain-containing protein [Catellatospora bangladeshensis]GIF81632.1 hypothetical protein Cba03nite_29810 [Catellatospora bangladeshensis]